MRGRKEALAFEGFLKDRLRDGNEKDLLFEVFFQIIRFVTLCRNDILQAVETLRTKDGFFDDGGLTNGDLSPGDAGNCQDKE